MSRVILALLDRPEPAEAVLRAAGRLAALEEDGHIDVLVIRRAAAVAVMPSEEVLTAEMRAAVGARERERAQHLRAIFQRWQQDSRNGAGAAQWLDVEGDPLPVLEQYARAADVVVLERPPEQGDRAEYQAVQSVLFHTGRPLLAVPAGWDGVLGRTVVVAWKPDDRAAGAVLAAVPYLKRAERAVILMAGAGAVPAIFTEHGISAEIHPLDTAGHAGEAILARAHTLGADLLVMGAFGHGRLREFIFGGVTRHVLAHAAIPVLMRH